MDGEFNIYKASIFNQRIDHCQLINLGFKGISFTCVGKRRWGVIMREKLDRALANDEW